jgi:hypothetical protein
MLDVRHPSHHLLKLPKQVEDQVPEPRMPQARFLSVPHRQAHRLLHFQIKQVQPVTTALYFGEKMLRPVSYPQHALDEHLIATLI